MITQAVHGAGDDRARARREHLHRRAAGPAGIARGHRTRADHVQGVAVAEEPAALPDGDRLRHFLGLLVPGGRGVALPRFKEMPGLTVGGEGVVQPQPGRTACRSTRRSTTTTSGSSVRRVAIAFFLATALGVPLGLFLGWSQKFREYVFPVFETLRPIPILAWVPLAILMFIVHRDAGDLPDLPGVVLRHRAEHHAGRQSIDESYIRAAYVPRREQVAGVPPRHRAGRAAVHLHRPADLGRRRVVLAGGRARWCPGSTAWVTSSTRRTRGAVPDDRHRHDHAGRGGLHHQRDGAHAQATT